MGAKTCNSCLSLRFNHFNLTMSEAARMVLPTLSFLCKLAIQERTDKWHVHFLILFVFTCVHVISVAYSYTELIVPVGLKEHGPSFRPNLTGEGPIWDCQKYLK